MVIENPDDSGDQDFSSVVNQIYALPDEGEYVLVLIEERPLSNRDVIEDLANRINLCVEFVLDGNLAIELPETVGHTIRIHVDHLEPADADAESFFSLVGHRLAERGIAFGHHLLEDPRRPALLRRALGGIHLLRANSRRRRRGRRSSID